MNMDLNQPANGNEEQRVVSNELGIVSPNPMKIEHINMLLAKAMVNRKGLDIMDYPSWPCPEIGDKVEIVSWDTQSNVQECVRVSKLPYLTIKAIRPTIVGIGNDRYAWSYEISVEETYLEFMQWHYKLLSLD